MNITISTQILAGNLGEGWNNNNAAADALASYTENTWREDLAELIEEGHTVEINIDVQKNAGGYSRDLGVDADTFEMTEHVESLLTNEQVIWEQFCGSEEAAGLYSGT